eukprot:1040080-Rhodomonas_salina.1
MPGPELVTVWKPEDPDEAAATALESESLGSIRFRARRDSEMPAPLGCTRARSSCSQNSRWGTAGVTVT